MMQKMILLGAGQMGQMALHLVRQSNYQVIAFADNNPAMQGKLLHGLPVISVENAVQLQPDQILISVVGQDRTQALKEQLQALHYLGSVQEINSALALWDVRGAILTLLSERLETLSGDIAELGVYQGDFSACLSRTFPDRTLYLFDTFAGFSEQDVIFDLQNGYSRANSCDFSDTSIETVRTKLSKPDRAVFLKGYFPDTAQEVNAQFALVSLDADLYLPTLNGLEWFYPRLVSGGVILLHDYYSKQFSGVRAAVSVFEQAHGKLLLMPVADLHGTALIVHP